MSRFSRVALRRCVTLSACAQLLTAGLRAQVITFANSDVAGGSYSLPTNPNVDAGFSFFNSSSAGSATLTITGDATHNRYLNFWDTSTAADATINVVNGAYTQLLTNATGGNATYNLTGSAPNGLLVEENATLGNATVNLVNSGSSLYFQSKGNGGTATVNLAAGTHLVIDSSFNRSGPTLDIGSLSGAGVIDIPANFFVQLSIGGNNQSTTFSGTLNAPVSSSPILNKVGTGTLTLSGAISFPVFNVVSAGTLSLTTLATFAFPSVHNGATLDYNQAFDGTVTTQIALAGGAFTKHGTGTVTLTESSNQGPSGSTTVFEGALQVAANAMLPGASLTLNGGGIRYGASFELRAFSLGVLGGTLDTNGLDVTYSSAISGFGRFTKAGAGNLTLTGANSYSGGTFVTGGTLTGDTTSLQGNITNSAAVVFNQASTGTYAGALRGTGAYTKTGAGELWLSGDSTFTGSLTLSQGVIRLTGTSGNQLSDLGSIVVDNGSLVMPAANETIGSIAGASGGRIDLFNGSGRTLTVGGNGASTTYAGIFTGTGGAVTKTGSGTLTLTGSSDNTGAFTVNDGTLQLGNSASVIPSSAPVVVNGGTFALGQVNKTIGSLAGTGGTVNLNNGGGRMLTVGDSTSTSFAGAITGAGGALVKTGSGTLTLSGVNDYSGGTTISAGTLAITSGSALAGGTVTDNATLAFTAASAFTYGGAIGGSGVVTKNGSATVTLSGSNTYSGGTTISAGTLSVTGTLAGAVSVASGATFDLAPASSGPFSGAISGSGAVTKNGAATLTLSGNNSGFTGSTSVNAGTLAIGHNTALGSGPLALASGATLADDGGTRTLANTITLPAGGSANFAGTGTLNLNGAISGATGAFTKTGTGTVILYGANSYAGGTFVTDGTLGVGANDRLADTGAVTVSGGTLSIGPNSDTVGVVTLTAGSIVGTTGTLTGSSYNVSSGTITANLGGSGALTKTGSGLVTLTGVNTYTGGTAVNVGGIGVIPASLPGNATVASGAFIEFQQGTAGTFAGSVSGAGLLSKTGAGTLTLTGANSPGSVTVWGGTLQLGNSGAVLADTAPVNLGQSGAALALGTASETIGPLSGVAGTTVNLGSQTLVANNPGTYTTFAGTIAGSGALAKIGAAGLELTGANTFAGGTQLREGVLGAGHDAALGTGTIDLRGGGILATGGARTLANAVTLSDDSAVSGNQALTFNGAWTLTRTRQLTVTNSAITTIAGAIGESGGPRALQKYGSGELDLTGANTYTGGTLIAEGTVRINNGTGSAFGTGSVTVLSGAALRGAGSFTGALENQGLYAPGNSPTLAPHSTFSQSSGATLEMELAGFGVRGTAYDALEISGAFLPGGTLSVLLIDGFNPTSGGTFDLFNWGSIGGTFDSVVLPPLVSGLSWDSSQLYIDGTLSITGVAAIPEPGTYALVVATLAIGAAGLRRRNSALRRPPSALRRLAAILCLLSSLLWAPRASAQVLTPQTYTFDYSTLGLNMWNGTGGGENTISYSQFLGGTVGTGISVGHISETLVGDFGATAFADVSATLGLNVNFKSTEGGIDLRAPYKVTLTPSSDFVDAGVHAVQVAGGLDSAALQAMSKSVVTTRFPSAEFGVDLVAGAKVTVGGEFAFFKRVGGSATLLDFTATIPIVSYNQNKNNKLIAFGTFPKDVANGVTLPLETSVLKQVASFAGASAAGPFSTRVGTVTVNPPHLDATSGNTFAAGTTTFATNKSQETVVNLSLDMIGTLTAAAGLPFNPLDILVNVGPLQWRGELFSARAGVSAGLDQTVTFTPEVHLVLRSNIDLTYNTPNGPVTTKAFDTTDLNQVISFTKPAGEIDLIPEFYIVPKLNNSVDLTLSQTFDMEALKTSVGRFGLDLFSLGPLWTFHQSSQLGDINIYNHDLDLSGVREFQLHNIEPGLTNKLPTILEVGANELYNGAGLTGNFNTASIDGALTLSANAFYLNNTPLNVSGTLMLLGAGNQMQTPRLSTLPGAQTPAVPGMVFVDTGSTLTITEANGWTDMTGATLTRGIYSVGGTLRYTGADITSNAATLAVGLGGVGLENTTGGAHNALRSLASNSGNLSVGGELTVGNALANTGTLVVAPNSTFNTQGFANSGGLVQLDGTLNTNASGSGTNTFTSVSAGGTLGAGRYLINAQGQLQFTGPTITVSDAEITIQGSNPDNPNQGPLYRSWFLNGASDDGLAGLTTNRNKLTVTNGAGQQFTSGSVFTNSAGATMTASANGHFDVKGNIVNQGTMLVDGGSITNMGFVNPNTGDYFAFNFTNTGTLEIKNAGRVDIGGGLGNFSNIDVDNRTGTLNGGTWLLSGLLRYGATGSSASAGVVNVKEIAAGTVVKVVGSSAGLFNQARNVDALQALAINRGTLDYGGVLQLGAIFDTFTNTGTLTVPGSLKFGQTLINSGTIAVPFNGIFGNYGNALTNLDANGVMTGLGNLTVGGTFSYIGSDIRALASGTNLTLSGTGSLRKSSGGGNGLAALEELRSGAQLHLADQAVFSSAVSNAGSPAVALTIKNGSTLGLDESSALLAGNGGGLVFESGATINNAGAIIVNAATTNGVSPLATSLVVTGGDVAFNGGGLVVLPANGLGTISATNGGRLINNGNLIGGAGTITAPLVNRDTIQSAGSAGLTLQPSNGALINSGVIEASATYSYPNPNDLSVIVQTPSPLTITGTTITNSEGATGGQVISSGILNLTNSTLNGGVLQANNQSAINLTATTVSGTTTTRILSGGKLVPVGTASTLGGTVNVDAGGLIDAAAGTALALGTVNNAGRIELGAGAALTGGTINNQGVIAAITSGSTATLTSALNVLPATTAGETAIAAGMVDIDRGGTLALGGGTHTNAGLIGVATAGDSSGTLSLLGNVTLNGAGTLQLGGNVNFTTNTGTNQVTFNSDTWGGTALVTGSGAFTLTNASNIVGAGDLGGGTLTLVNAAGGTLRANASGTTLNLHPGAGGFTNDGMLQVDAGAIAQVNGTFTNFSGTTLTRGTYRVSGDLVFSGANLVTNAADLTLTGSAATVRTPGGASALANLATNASGAKLTLNGGKALSYATALTNSGQIVLGGTGPEAGGALTLGALDGSGSVSLANSTATLTLGSAATNGTFSGNITGSGALVKNGASIQTLTGTNTYTGGTTINGGALVGSVAALPGSIVNNSGLVFDEPGTATFNGTISGAGFLVKSGAGTVTLANNQTYSGTTNINGGTLQLGNTGNILPDTASVVVNAGTLALGTSYETIGALYGSGGNVSLTNGFALAVWPVADWTYYGSLSGGGGFAMIGAGSETLMGNSTYSGGTRLVAGALVAGHDAAFGTGALALEGGTLSAFGAHTLANAVNLFEETTIAGTSALTLSGAVTLFRSRELTISNTAPTTFSGVVSESGGARQLLKYGAGELILANANTYTGGTLLAAGTTRANNGSNGSAFGTGAVTLASGATLGGNGRFTGALTANGTLAPGSATGAAGALTAGNTTLPAGGSYRWEITNAAGSAGTNWDVFTVSGALTVTASSAAPFTLTADTLGTLAGFNNAQSYAWPIITTTVAMSSLNAGGLALNLNSFSGAGNASSFALGLNAANTSLALRYLPNDAPLALAGDTVFLKDNSPNLGSLSGASGKVALDNSTLTIGGDNTSTGFGGALTGTGGISKHGAGTLTLTGANTYAGGTTLYAGALQIDANSRLGTGALTFRGGTLRYGAAFNDLRAFTIAAGGATLDTNGFDVTYSPVIAGSLPFTKTGAGTLTLAGANTHSGGTNVTGGLVQIDADSRLGTGGLTLDGGGVKYGAAFDTLRQATLGAGGTTLDTNGFNVTYAPVLSGSGGLIKAGTGTLTLNASQTFTGTTTVNGGTLALTAGGSLYSGGTAAGSVVVNNGGTLLFSRNDTFGVHSSTPLSTVTINAGGVVASNNSFTTLNNLTLNGGELRANGGANGTFPSFQLKGTVSVTGSSQITTTGAALSGVQIGNATANGTTTFDVANAASLTVAAPLWNGAGVVSGLIKTGAGTLTLSGPNTFTGSTTVSAGTLQLSSGDALPDSGAVVVNGGTLAVAANETIGSLAGTGGMINLGTASLTIGDNVSTTTFAGTITGTGGILTKNATSTLTLTGDNTHGDRTSLWGGTLVVGHDHALGTGRLVLNGGTLAAGNLANGATRTVANSVNLNGSPTIGGTDPFAFTGAWTIGNSSQTLTVTNTAATTISGGIGESGGSFGFTKAGPGTLTFAGGNTFSGGLTLSGGTLAVSSNGNLGAGGAPVRFGGGTLRATADFTAARPMSLLTGGGVFDVVTGVTLTWGGSITGAAGNALTKIGSGTLQLSAANTYSGDTFVNAGTLRLLAGNALSPNTRLVVASGANFDANGFAMAFSDLNGSGAIDVGAGGLTAAPSGTNNFGGTLGGSGGFTMNGSGTLSLDHANTYSGPTTVNQGTVKLGANGALPANTPVTLAVGATLDLNGHAATLGKLEGLGGTVKLTDASLALAQGGNSTFAGVLSGNGGLAKDGAGALTLTGLNTFTGATALGGGKLIVNGSLASSPITVSGGVLGGSGTVGPVTVGAGGTFAPGNSPGLLMVEGDLSLSGTTQMELAGLLRGDSYDATDVHGSILFGGTLEVVLLGGFNPASGASFNLFDWTGSANGTFASMNLPGLTSGLAWNTSALYTSGVLSVTTSAIPEPSVSALCAGLAVVALAMRRRTRAKRMLP